MTDKKIPIIVGKAEIVMTTNDVEEMEVLIMDKTFTADLPEYGKYSEKYPGKIERDDPKFLASFLIYGDPQILLEYCDFIWVTQHGGESRLLKNKLFEDRGIHHQVHNPK